MCDYCASIVNLIHSEVRLWCVRMYSASVFHLLGLMNASMLHLVSVYFARVFHLLSLVNASMDASRMCLCRRVVDEAKLVRPIDAPSSDRK